MSNTLILFPKNLADGPARSSASESPAGRNRRFRLSVPATTNRQGDCHDHTVRDGKLIATEVYFGWDLPHAAPRGGFTENKGQGHA